MKIAYLSPSFPPLLGGMGTACYYTANEIGKSHEVTVFLPARRFGGANRKNTAYQTGNYKIELIKPWFSFGYADFLPQILWRLKNFDLVHLYYPYFGVAEFLWLLKKIKGKKAPKIIFHHAMETVGQGIVKIIATLHKKLLQPLLMKSADAIFVLSKDYAENSDITPFYKKWPEKFFEVPHGVDLSLFCHPESLKNKPDRNGDGIPRPAFCGARNDNPRNFIIFTAQALDKQHYFKGIDVLLKSLALQVTSYKLQVTLLIAGDGNLRNYYETLAHQLNVQQNIKFLGQINHQELPNYYNLADVTVVPSTTRTECFSLTAVESMACGTPVIVSDWPGVRATIENNKSGLIVKPGDEKDLAEKISFLYQHPEILKTMGENTRKRAEEKYDWEKICKDIINYYSLLLSS